MSEKLYAVCSDIDGTAVVGDNLPSPQVQQASKYLRDHDIPLILATARDYEMLSPFLNPAEGIDMLHLEDNHCVLNGGATVVRANTGHVEWEQRLSRLDGYNIVRDIGSLCSNVHYDKETKLLTPAQLLAGIERGDYLTSDIPALFAILPKANAVAVREVLSSAKAIGNPRFMAYDVDPQQLCVQLGSDKGLGNGKALELRGLTGKHVIKVGNGANDLDLFFSAPGPNVAIDGEDTDPELLRVADWIAPPVHQDGLAATIDRFAPYFA